MKTKRTSQHCWGHWRIADLFTFNIATTFVSVVMAAKVVELSSSTFGSTNFRHHHVLSDTADSYFYLRCPTAVITDTEENTTSNAGGNLEFEYDKSRGKLRGGHCDCNLRLLEIRCTGGLTSLPVHAFQMVSSDGRVHHRPNGRSAPFTSTQIAAWHTFHASGQLISAIHSGSFANYPARRIVLNFNPLGERIDSDAFRAISPHLRELHLGACRINVLPSGMLHGLVELRRLHLWANSFDAIPVGFFRRVRQLRELVMWGNRIEEIEERTFDGLVRLRRLDLDRNRIQAIDPRAFAALPELELLRLSGNSIHVVDTKTFAQLSNLKMLGLDSNGLGYVYPDAFYHLRNLEVLTMSDNIISFLADDVFATQGRLVILRLADNHLAHAWSRTFAGLRTLTFLDLAGNRLVRLPSGTFRHAPRLAHLRLDRNLLRSMERCVLDLTDATRTFSAEPRPLAISSDRRVSDRHVESDSDCTVDNIGVNGERYDVGGLSQQPSTVRRMRTLSFTGNSIPCDCRLAWIIGGGSVDSSVDKTEVVGGESDSGKRQTDGRPSSSDDESRTTQKRRACDSQPITVENLLNFRPVRWSWGQCADGPFSLVQLVANDTSWCAGVREEDCTD